MESHLHKMDAEKTAHDSENSKLLTELATKKQSNSRLTEDNITLKKQIAEKDKRLHQLEEDLKTERDEKADQVAWRKLEQYIVSKFILLNCCCIATIFTQCSQARNILNYNKAAILFKVTLVKVPIHTLLPTDQLMAF